VHRRLGGSRLSLFYLRYIIRRLLGPAWRLRLALGGKAGRDGS